MVMKKPMLAFPIDQLEQKQIDNDRRVRMLKEFQSDDIFCLPEEIFVSRENAREFMCPINHGVYNDPYIDKEGHSFCKKCIFRWFSMKKVCPITNLPIDEDELKPNLDAKAKIDELDVYCVNKKKGCNWIGKRCDIMKHLDEECGEVLIACPNTCPSVFLRKDFGQHEREACPFSLVPCPYSKVIKCDLMVFSSPISSCEWILTRK
jgi:hypothetical protein